MKSMSQPTRTHRRVEHLPTLGLSAFWFWIVLLVLVCGCGLLFISITPIFPHPTAAAPPTSRAQAPDTDTATPEPSATPAPTATSAPIQANVIEDKVNLRSAPNTQASIVGKLNKNDRITLVGRSADNQWYQTTIAGKTAPAWVFADTLQIVSGDPTTLPIGK